MAKTAKQNERLVRLRQRARTDLFWLAREILGYDALTEEVHGPVCRHFVQKDRSKPLAEQDTVKQRLLLDPRDHFKTTLDIADTVQWLLNFPDVRILLMTGTRELAARMVRELKWHFQSNVKLRALFPDYAAPAKDWGTTEEFVVPARTAGWLREPSVSISTVESVKAGSHYDVIKCDDLVNEINSQTAEQIEKVIDAFNHTTPILEPFGYRDVIGTRYDYSDLYGWIIDNNRGEWKVLARRACKLESDGSIKSVLFPARFSPERLEEIRRADPYLFNCQYLNDPTPPEEKQFPRDLILSHTIPMAQVPLGERHFVAWDLSFGRSAASNYSVGVAGRYDAQGRLFVLDLVRGRFDPHELVQHIFLLTLRWKPVRVGIEKAAGSELLEPGLRAFAETHQLYLPLEWIPVKVQKDAKASRIASLQTLLRQNKLYFAAPVVSEDLLKEFERFPKYRFDDIPDAVSLLLHFRPMVDIYIPPERVEMVHSPALTGCEVLGAGLVG